MNYIDKVSIKGLWGEAIDVNFNCDKQLNFLIGTNGTGKTTVINLISAILTADFDKIDKTEFTECNIFLRAYDKNKKPSICVYKKKKEDLPYYDIFYEIRRSQSEKPKEFDFDALQLERAYRGAPIRSHRERMAKEHFIYVKKEIESLIRVSFLSIHRHNEESHQEDRRNILPIDKKILSIRHSLTNYFSTLSAKYEESVVELQKETLLSVLTTEKPERIYDFSRSLKIEKEKEDLVKVFDLLEVNKSKYQTKIRDSFKDFERSLSVLAKGEKISVQDFLAMYNIWRSHSVVSSYHRLEEKKKEIFAKRDHFVSIINRLFVGKKVLTINMEGDISFSTNTGREVNLEDLSSGEKQILIILGESLLQQDNPVVFIADEPELSLHVIWQEQLVDSVVSLNNKAQILFATHSPDIVSYHKDKIIKMDGIINGI